MSEMLAGLPSARLLARVRELVRRGNAVEAELLVHLAEVDARQLYLEEGCSSMFTYCWKVLHFAEGVAYKRIQAARAARRHPQILEALRRGNLHLTAVGLLAPKLTETNCFLQGETADRKPPRALAGKGRRVPPYSGTDACRSRRCAWRVRRTSAPRPVSVTQNTAWHSVPTASALSAGAPNCWSAKRHAE